MNIDFFLNFFISSSRLLRTRRTHDAYAIWTHTRELKNERQNGSYGVRTHALKQQTFLRRPPWPLGQTPYKLILTHTYKECLIAQKFSFEIVTFIIHI